MDGYGQAPPAGYGGGPQAHAYTGAVEGQERSYGIVLLLYIVTLGIYGLFWHYKTHDELMRQFGRENKDKGLWFAYIGVYVVMFVVAIIAFITILGTVMADVDAGRQPSEADVFAVMASLGGLLVVVILGALAAIVLFIIYVLRQFSALDEAHRRTNMSLRLGAGGFMGLYIGGLVAGWVVPFVGGIAQIVMQIIAYYLFQENYNQIWRGITKEGRPLPTDAEWQAGGGRPTGAPASTAWDAPGQPGAAPAAHNPGPAGNPGAAPQQPQVSQSFACPRCQQHMSARGPPGSRVPIQCTHCGESGQVTLPG